MITSIANSLGFGSGIDTTQLVNSLAAASRGPKVDRFDGLNRSVQAKISALGQARSDLESFATSLSTLVAGGTLRSQPVVSDEAALSATAAAGSRLGTLTGEIGVRQLARAQSSVSDVMAGPSAPIGLGSITLHVGGATHFVTIDATNNTLDGLAAAINATASGVRATVAADQNGARLVLKGETGAANAFTLTADPALAAFTTSAMATGQVAQDAMFTLDGVNFVRTNNSVSDILPGISFTLKRATPGSTVSISAQRPTEALRQTIGEFVSVFNTLKRNLAEARRMTGGDVAMRTLDQDMSALVSKPVTSGALFSSLSDIGIATNRDGSVSLNTAKLDAALAADPDAVEALFNPIRDATHNEASDPGIAHALSSIRDAATTQNGVLNGLSTRLQKEVQTIAQDREKMETRETNYRARLERQFGSMDARIGALKATQSYLSQQIKLWSNER
jgi:flagellar hook-associated protein 2